MDAEGKNIISYNIIVFNRAYKKYFIYLFLITRAILKKLYIGSTIISITCT